MGGRKPNNTNLGVGKKENIINFNGAAIITLSPENSTGTGKRRSSFLYFLSSKDKDLTCE